MEIMFTVAILIALPLFMMSNLLLNKNSMLFFLSWLTYLSPFKMVSEILYVVLWTDRKIICDDIDSICEFSTGQQVLEDSLHI